MKNLIPYHLFEDSRTTSNAGTLPKIDTDALAPAAGKRADPNGKGKVDNYMSNWFERLGQTIENLSGNLIKDPKNGEMTMKKAYREETIL